MLQVSFTSQFKKDYKLCKKRGYNMELIQSVIDILAIPVDFKVSGTPKVHF